MKIIFFLISILLISCSHNNRDVKEKIIGRWEINEIKFNNKDYLSYLYSNILIFEKNGIISIPETVHFIEDKNSKWNYVDGKIKIMTTNLAFKDTFDFSFLDKSEMNPRGLILRSDSIYIKLYNLFDLEKN